MGNKTIKDLRDSLFFVRTSGGYYHAANGIMVMAGPDEPRFEYDPETGEYKGCLIETTVQNMVYSTEDFSAATWTKSDLTVETNSHIAPTGYPVADSLTANTTSGYKRLVYTRPGSEATVLLANTAANGNVNVSISVANTTVIANGINLVYEGITVNSYIRVGPTERKKVVTINAAGDFLTVDSAFLSDYTSAIIYKMGLAINAWTTYSAYIKPKGNTENVWVRFGGDFNVGGCLGKFTLSGSGAAAASGNSTTKVFIKKIANTGWYRCSVSGRSSANGIPYSVFISPLDSTDSDNYPGDGVSGIYLWGAQLEFGDIPSSYFPTSNTFLAARSGDQMQINTDSWFSNTTGNFATHLYPAYSNTLNISGTTITRNTADGALGRLHLNFRTNDVVSFASNSSNVFLITSVVGSNTFTVNVSPGAATDTTIIPIDLPRPYQPEITMRLVYSTIYPGIYSYTSKLYTQLDGSTYKRFFWTSASLNYMSSSDSIANNVPGTNTVSALTISAASTYNTSFRGIAANGNIISFSLATNANMLFATTNTLTLGVGSYGMYLKKFEYYPKSVTAAELLAFTANT
jgi:hypothetical protein